MDPKLFPELGFFPQTSPTCSYIVSRSMANCSEKSMLVQRERKVSCWTCRLRHKKCDAALPICGACTMLEIDCHYDADRPDWMDNGERQKQKAQRVKAQIQQIAKKRRGVAQLERILEEIFNAPKQEQTSPTLNTDSSPIQPHQPQLPETADLAYRNENAGFRSILGSVQGSSDLNGQPTQLDTSVRPPAEPSRQDLRLDSATPRSEYDMAFITAYLDYVFPSIFPFYKPSILDGGRSWVLVLATANNSFFRSIISLSVYFFYIVPVSPDPAYKTCIEKLWKGLQTQVASALSTIQRDLITINRRGVGGSLLDSVYLMANIVQYLSFEIAIRSGKWIIHLKAATDLFEQILRLHGKANGKSSFRTVLSKLKPARTEPEPDGLNADQKLFKFFSSILLVNDVLASTSLGQPPKLTAYYSELDGGDKPPILRSEDVLGCQPWILLAVADIAAFSAWKKEVYKRGELKPADMFSRAATIENRIHVGVQSLDEMNASLGIESAPNLQTYLRHLNFPYDLGSSIQKATDDITRIWAYAAHTYLLVVTQGWDLSDHRIRRNTKKSMHLFQKILSPCWLRCLVWPFCVSGCVAIGDERQAFRNIGGSMQALKAFGTVQDALRIMETVWSNDKIDPKSWDIGACLTSLGYGVLLV
ncbi:fungal-specific transcription factor domain-containing protein [Mariannaea sp. PMI_226]|nr:fungal-specific transcription factor domain-containing protein [Mariannaea sp. PMI_226]